MPHMEQACRYQKALLWQAEGFDDYGQFKVSGSPQEISVRWNSTRSESLDPLGNTISLDATAVVDRKIPIGSVMWLGELQDWLGTGSGSGLEDSEVHEVVTYDETPDMRNRVARREVGLKRHKDSLPELA